MKRRAEQSLAEGNGLENHGKVKDFLDNAGDIGKVINGRTVQRWREQWESEEGGFLLDHRGKESNISLLDDEDLQLQLATWMKSRLNAVSPNELNVVNTWNYINKTFLPLIDEDLRRKYNVGDSIAQATAWRWMKKAGGHRDWFRQNYYNVGAAS
jgi:hypothetical protein